MEGKEKWILGIGLVLALCLSVANFAALNTIKKNESRRKKVQTGFQRKFNIEQKQIKKAFDDAEKNFKTTKKNFEIIGGRLDRLEQELLTTRGGLLKMKSQIKERAKEMKKAALRRKILEKKKGTMPVSGNSIKNVQPTNPSQ